MTLGGREISVILVRALQLFYDLMVLTPPSLIFSNHSIQPSIHIINKKVHDFEVKIQTWGCVFSGGMLVKAGPGHYNAKLCGFFSLNDSLWPNIRYLSFKSDLVDDLLTSQLYPLRKCCLIGWCTLNSNNYLLKYFSFKYPCLTLSVSEKFTHKEVNRQHCSI